MNIKNRVTSVQKGRNCLENRWLPRETEKRQTGKPVGSFSSLLDSIIARQAVISAVETPKKDLITQAVIISGFLPAWNKKPRRP